MFLVFRILHDNSDNGESQSFQGLGVSVARQVLCDLVLKSSCNPPAEVAVAKAGSEQFFGLLGQKLFLLADLELTKPQSLLQVLTLSE